MKPNATALPLFRFVATLTITAVLTIAVSTTAYPTTAVLAILGVGSTISILSLFHRFSNIALAVCILSLPPSVVTEGSTRATILAVAAYAGLVLFKFVTARQQNASTSDLQPAPGRLAFALGTALMASAFIYSGALKINGSLPEIRYVTAIAYLVIGFSTIILTLIPDEMIETLKCLFWVVSLASLSYLTTLISGTFGTGPSLQIGGDRKVQLDFPLTLSGGQGGFLEGIPRMLLLSGEGGINVEFVIPVAVFAFYWLKGRKRIVGISILAVPLLFGQASTTILALLVAAAIALFVSLAQRGNLLLALFLTAALSWFTWLAAGRLVEVKNAVNAGSLSDRGFAFGSGASGQISNTLGEINLYVTIFKNPVMATAIIALLGALLWMGRESKLTIAAVAVLAVTALFGQPMHWHVMTWSLFFIGIYATYIYRGCRLPSVETQDRAEVCQ